MAKPFHWDFEARNVAFKLRVCGSPAGDLLSSVGHVQCLKMLLIGLAIECMRPAEASKRAPVAYRLHCVNVWDPQKRLCSLRVRAGACQLARRLMLNAGLFSKLLHNQATPNWL